MTKMFSIPSSQLVETADRFFKGYKRFQTEISEMQKTILGLQVKYLLDTKYEKAIIKSSEENPTIYFSILANYAQVISDAKKSVVFVGKSFLFLYSSDANLID